MHSLRRLKAFLFFAALVLVVWSFKPGPNLPKAGSPDNASDGLPSFIVISDIHLHSSKLQSQITLKESDTGYDLWDTAQKKIRSVLAGQAGYSVPKFIIVLGDLVWHTKDTMSGQLESARDNMGVVLRNLRGISEDSRIPLLYVPGNNDSWDGDYHPFSTKIFDKDEFGKPFWPVISKDPISEDVDVSSLPRIIDDSKLNLGCYSAYPLGKKGKLRVIALNTTMFVHKYTDTANQKTVATAQMNWFAAQLEEAAKQKEYVLIAMHVPPGIDGYKKKDFWRKVNVENGKSVESAFIDLVDKYKKNIIGMLSSHTHMDGIRRIYNSEGKLICVDISVPGITPGHGNNPGFKLVTYNPANYELENFTTLYENYFPDQKVISWGNDAYDFKTEFGCPKGTSIKACLDTINTGKLQSAVQSIYNVKNGTGNVDEVNSAIDVRVSDAMGKGHHKH